MSSTELPKNYIEGDPLSVPPGLNPKQPLAITRATVPTVDNPLPLEPPTYAETVAPLKYDATTNEGSIGWPVYSIQAGLKARGFNIVADGIFGATTKKKVENFQENNGLTADGVVGPATKRALVEKVAMLVDEVRPSLPNNLIRELSRAEGGDNPAAINEYDPPTGPHGTDCGIVQLRCLDPYTREDLKRAFDPFAAMTEAANRFDAAKTKYMTYGWTRNNRVRAEHCALMNHNWPVGANDIAFEGRLSNPDGIAAWVPPGVRMLDGTTVNTRLEWVQFYSGLLGGDPPHCGFMVSKVMWGV